MPPGQPVKPCPKCQGHLSGHSSAMNTIDYHYIPGMPVAEVTAAHDHENHQHGTRKCDCCRQDFHGHFGFSDNHPDSPAKPFARDAGRMALVHKKCEIRFKAQLEAEKQASG